MRSLVRGSMRAVRRILPESRERRVAVYALLAVLVLGVIVRGLFMLAWSPAFMGWPDAKSYIDVSQTGLFENPLRPAGYPLFLVVLNAIWTNIYFVVVVNHLLGLATAVLLYATVVRVGGPRWLGLVPATLVALGGDQMFLEHSVLSEPLFTFLTAFGVYAAVRCAGDGRTLPWAAASGVALALATSVRVVGMATIVIICAWMVFGASGALRQRVLTAATAAVGALAILGSYWIAEYSTTGMVGMSRNGDYHLYGRVAPFADCTKFTPPRGTEMLCEKPRRAPDRRRLHLLVLALAGRARVRVPVRRPARGQCQGRRVRARGGDRPTRRLPGRGRCGHAALRRAGVRLAARLRRRPGVRGVDRTQHPAEPELPQPRDRLAAALLRLARERLRDAVRAPDGAARLRARHADPARAVRRAGAGLVRRRIRCAP